MRVNFFAECDYRHGYKKALLDIKEWFERHSESIKFYHKYNKKGIESILAELNRNSDKLREEGGDLDIIIKKEEKDDISGK